MKCYLKGSNYPLCIICYLTGCECYPVDLRDLVSQMPEEPWQVSKT